MLWLKFMAMAEKIPGMVITSDHDTFNWVDDGRHDVIVTVNIMGEEDETRTDRS